MGLVGRVGYEIIVVINMKFMRNILNYIFRETSDTNVNINVETFSDKSEIFLMNLWT